MMGRWIVRRAIDADVPLSQSEQSECVNEAYEGLYRDGGLALMLLVMSPTVVVFYAAVSISFSGASHWLISALIALTFITFTLSTVLIPVPFARRRVRGKVRQRGVEVCVQCGYWLRGLDSSITRCPECGAAREEMPEHVTKAVLRKPLEP